MAVNFDDFDMGPVWASLDEDQRNDILSLVYGRLATFGIASADDAVSPTQQSAVAVYARKLADTQGAGEDIDIPAMVREMLTITDRNAQLRPVSLFSPGQAATQTPQNGSGGSEISEMLRNSLVVGGSFDENTGELTLAQHGDPGVVIDLSNLQAQSTIFGVPEGKDGEILRYNNGQAFFDTPGGNFFFSSDLVALWADVSDDGNQDPLEITQDEVPGSRPAATWQEGARSTGLFRGMRQDVEIFRAFSLFPNRAVISTDEVGNIITDNDGNSVYKLENPYIILLIPGTLTGVKQRPRDGASDGSDDEDVLANFSNTGTVMLNADGTPGAGDTAYTRYAWNYPPTRQPRRNQFSETSGANEVRLLISYDIAVAAAPDVSQRAITNEQIQTLLTLADNPMGVTTLNELSDVDVAGATNGMVLSFLNGSWIASTSSAGLDRNGVISIIDPEIDHLYESAAISGRNLVLTTHGGEEDDIDIVTPVVNVIRDFLLPVAQNGEIAVRRSGAWAAEPIPASGLSQSQVDARVRSVASAAHVGVSSSGTSLSFDSLAGSPDVIDLSNPVNNVINTAIPVIQRVPALGTAGQLLATNQTEDGTEFVDPPMASSGGGGGLTTQEVASADFPNLVVAGGEVYLDVTYPSGITDANIEWLHFRIEIAGSEIFTMNVTESVRLGLVGDSAYQRVASNTSHIINVQVSTTSRLANSWGVYIFISDQASANHHPVSSASFLNLAYEYSGG